jgi:hypothetical protein
MSLDDVAVMLYTRILEVFGSNLCQDSGNFVAFFSPSKQIPE